MMKLLLYCNRCGNKLQAESKFCQNCGTAQDEQPQGQYAPPPSHQHAPPPQQVASPPVKKKGKALRIVAIIFGAFVGVFILLGVIGSLLESAENDIGPPIPATTESEVLTGAQIFANNRDATIIIRTDLGGGSFGTGSGFIVCSSGIAVTNHHVMDGAITASAILYDGRQFDITGFYSYDIGNDLAVIQVDGLDSSFDYMIFGDSDTTVVGETVFAIGGPEWEPITFTSGMITRIAYQPVNFSIYSIAGMLSHEAAIYKGNSGGPLLNDRGQVIGVNAAGNMVRASVQFAVPINRVVLPATGATVNPLPIGGAPAPPQPIPGHIFTYDRFPFIPDFLSVSHNATLHFSGTPTDLGLLPGDIVFDFYDYLYIYDLPFQYATDGVEAFTMALFERGFISKGVEITDDEAWMYLFHPEQNVSLSYFLMTLEDSFFLLIAVVEGNVHERLHPGSTPVSPPTTPAPGYARFPSVPIFGAASATAVLMAEGFALSDFDVEELLLDGNLYIVSDDYAFIYDISQTHIDADYDVYQELLFAHGFQQQRSAFHPIDNFYAALYWHPSSNIFVSLLYDFENELFWVVIG